MIYGLLIENPATGYRSLKTYEDAFSRGLDLILLRVQPLILVCVDWPS